jgi:hypothetical protein
MPRQNKKMKIGKGGFFVFIIGKTLFANLAFLYWNKKFL